MGDLRNCFALGNQGAFPFSLSCALFALTCFKSMPNAKTLYWRKIKFSCLSIVVFIITKVTSMDGSCVDVANDFFFCADAILFFPLSLFPVCQSPSMFFVWFFSCIFDSIFERELMHCTSCKWHMFLPLRKVFFFSFTLLKCADDSFSLLIYLQARCSLAHCSFC